MTLFEIGVLLLLGGVLAVLVHIRRELHGLPYRMADVPYHLRGIRRRVDDLYDILETKLRPPRPQNARVTLVGENPMADSLQYKVALDPLPEGTDVVSRKLTVTVDGADRDPIVVGKDEAFPDLFVPQDSQVRLRFVNIDDAELESPPLEFEFQAKDTIPPGAPSGVSVTLVGETEGNSEYTAPADAPAPSDPASPEEQP